ncbi:HEAT repeat domain-containing protein [Actinoplanes utahensis]|uniref:NACHT domain-containing protein n=1 Tax=Actinoplanes utahensis TaxID=1869 RepID=A0A0A6UG46_ACTUT|nr:HEAT repeat domain-containing protein [Actinoplanes utahensis]KHD74068.1 hypothetical protein MB27_30975 [Actinoplanes utahensis]GIF29700.1 hypothetical protein Aut01nite_26860 [Actinoplanes utahensis]
MDVTAAHRFAGKLTELRARSGNPSVRELERHMPFARSTISDNLSGRSLPSWAFVEAFVRACGHAAGTTEESLHLAQWREALRQAKGIAAAAPDRDFPRVREAYLERIRRRYGHAELGALAPGGDPDRPGLIPLREIFVPPEVRADPPPVELPRELVRRLVDRGEIRHGDLPPGIDAETLDRIRRSHRGQPARPVLDVIADDTRHGLVLLGDPGAGKSTVARYLTLRLAEAGDEGTLPVLVELRAYADARWRTGTLLDLIERLSEAGGHGLPRTVLEGYLRAGGRAVMIFDGLDEIFDPRLREEVADEIAGLAARFPSARVVVTSRVIGYQRSVFDREEFRTYLLQDLDRPRIERFLTAWYRLAAGDRPAEADRLRDRLLAAMDEVAAVRELAGNPLLLTIMAMLGRKRDLPRDRRDVYEHAVAVLAAQWDPSRHLRDERHTREHADLDVQDRLALLRRIARRMQDAPAGLAGNHLLDHDLIDEVAGFLRSEHGLPPGRAKAVARAITDEFRTRNFILSHYGAGVHGFVHRAFLEYLTAAGIADRVTTGDDDLLQVYARRWPDPAWEETLVLLAGMVEPAQAGQIVDHLLTADPLWFLGPRDPGIGRSSESGARNIMTALRCLNEVRDVAALPRQCSAAVNAVINMLEHIAEQRVFAGSPVARTLVETAAPMLTRIGGHHPRIRSRYRDWYLMRGRFLRIPLEGEDFIDFQVPPAAQTGAGLLRDDGEFAAVLNGLVRFGDVPALRDDVLDALARGRPGDPEVLASLRDVAEHDSIGAARRGMVQGVAMAARPAGAAWDWVQACLADDDPFLRDGAVAAFGFEWRAHPEALPIVCRAAVTDRDPSVRSAAIGVLAVNWTADPRAGAALREIARSDAEPSVRIDAADRLIAAWSTEPETVSLLRRVVDDPAIPRWFRSRLRQELVGVTTAGPVARPLPERSADPRRIRLDAVIDAARGTDLSRERAVAARPEDRIAIVRALAVGWAGDPALLPWLCDLARTTTDGRLTETILWTVATTWPDRSEQTELMRDVLAGDFPADVRGTAMMLLAAGGRADPAVPELLRKLTGAEDDHVRSLAVELLGTGWPRDPEIVALVRSFAETDGADAVRYAALKALLLARRPDPETLELLRRMAVADSDPRMRRFAVEHLTVGWHDDPATLALVRRQAVNGVTGDDRAAAVQALAGGWRGDPATRELLHGFVAQGEEADPDRWRAAIRALAERWPYDQEIVGLAGRIEAEEEW